MKYEIYFHHANSMLLKHSFYTNFLPPTGPQGPTSSKYKMLHSTKNKEENKSTSLLRRKGSYQFQQICYVIKVQSSEDTSWNHEWT